jgi:hypothetical protein
VLEVLEDRTLLSGAKPLALPVFGPTRTVPLPADLSGPNGLSLASGAAATALALVTHSATGTPGDRHQAAFVNNVPTPLVNNPAMDQNQLNPEDTQSETSLLLIPPTTGTTPSILSAFNDSSAYNAYASTQAALQQQKFTGYSLSSNGGTTFADKGVLPTYANGDGGDPVLARNSTTGTIYFTALTFGEFVTGIPSLAVFRSTDNGLTFSLPSNSVPGFAAGDTIDKPWLAVDNNAGTGNGTVYQVFRDFSGSAVGGIYLTHSTDGGVTWGPNAGTLIASEGSFNVQGAYVAVGPDHAVYVFWLDQSAGSGTANSIRMRKSTNLGVSFGPTLTVATLQGTGTNGDLNLTDNLGNYFRSNSFPQAVVNPTNANDIYVVFNDVGTALGDKADVYFVESTNGGFTWSARARVNTDSTHTDNWSPALAITPDGTHLGVFWYDRSGDVTNNNLITRFGRQATITGGGATVTWGTEAAVSNVAFPPEFGHDPAVNPVYMGDYDQVVADNSFFYGTWGDNRTADNAHPGNNPDVRFAKVAVGSTAVPANVLVNNPNELKLWNPPNDTQTGSSLLVVPGTTPTIVSAFTDSGSWGLTNDPSSKYTGYSQSANGGTSFSDKGRLPTSPDGDLGKPVLARDAVSGKIYLVTMSFSQFFTTPQILVFASTDNGTTYGAPVNASPGANFSDYADQPWIAVDNATGAGQGTVYVAWNDVTNSSTGASVLRLTHSSDGGVTWGTPPGIAIATGDGSSSYVNGPDVVVGPDHSVYVFWFQQNLFLGNASIMEAVSHDGGNTFGAPVVVTTLRSTAFNGNLGLTTVDDLAVVTNSFPQAAVNPANGHIYVVYNDVGTATGDKADVFLRESSTGGASWGAALRVNSDTGHNDQWQPSLAVTPDGSHIGVFWYDRRLDVAENDKVDRFGALGTAGSGGVAFTSNIRISNNSFRLGVGFDPTYYIFFVNGEHEQAAADNSFFYTSWTDYSTASKGHPGKEADVRFAKLAVPTPAPWPAAASLAGSAGTSILVRLPSTAGTTTITAAGAGGRAHQTLLAQPAPLGNAHGPAQETVSAVAYWRWTSRAATVRSLDDYFALGGTL